MERCVVLLENGLIVLNYICLLSKTMISELRVDPESSPLAITDISPAAALGVDTATTISAIGSVSSLTISLLSE